MGYSAHARGIARGPGLARLFSSIITSCGPEAALFLNHAVVLQSHESYAIYNMTVCEV